MMRLLGIALGEGRIYGDKFPQERQIEDFKRRASGETLEQYEYRLYVNKLIGKDAATELEHVRDMNPNGFWECPFTVRGVRYSSRLESKLCELEAEVANCVVPETICKIVSQGLSKSDPRYISKVIFMVRHPRAVAKSQERLKREMKFSTEDGKPHDLYAGEVVHSPKMFIDVTVAAMLWIEAHPTIPVLFVRYDDMIGDARETLDRVAEFLGEGDAGSWIEAAREIDPSLRRSYPEEKKSNLWGDAEYIYKALETRNFEAVHKFVDNPGTMTHREKRSWPCLRCEQEMIESHCLRCKKNHDGFRTKLREFADEKKIPWRERPCAFEVAYDLDNSLIDIESSIADNFWVCHCEERTGS
jgi:hypothetical protein